MVGLIGEIVKRILFSLLLVSGAGFLFNKILSVGENPFQSIVVLSFYVYCILSLFTFSTHKLFHVLSLPVLTQFIHIFQKYTFTTGANSIWRLFPFIILNFYLINFFLRQRVVFSQKNKLFIFFWLVVNIFFIFISSNLKNIIWGGILLYLFILPLLFAYLKHTIQAIDFNAEIEMYLCLLFIILGLGTFGLVFAGAGYKGSNNLLATRNIADTNVTMAYFILLWPFVLLCCSRRLVSQLFKFAMLLIFSGVVILSFSRGALLIVIPYLVITVLLSKNFLGLKWLIPLLILITIYSSKIGGFLEKQDLTYFWKLRFGDITSLESLLAKLESISGRAEIHQVAYSLFLHQPFIGHGIGSFEILGPGYREAHSMWFTLLAEQGLTGAIYVYGIFITLSVFLAKLTLKTETKYSVLLVSLLFYLLFNHTVGSVFVILPGKSITVNCIAPILIMCLYFYAKSIDNVTSFNETGYNQRL